MLNKSNSCATLLILIEQLAATEELAKQKRMSRSLETKINIASSEADSLEAELAAREAKSTLEQAFSALQQESLLLRLSILNAAIQAIKEKLNERYIALQSGTNTVYIGTSIYANFYKQLLTAETETKIAVQNEFLRKLAVLQSEIAKVECVYQAILIPPNDLQKQHDQIYNLISSLLSINAGNIKQQLSCDLINLDKNINLLLSEPITLCAAASASYTLDENEHSIIQLYDDARAERNSQILHKLDTTITRYKEFQELYSYISEGERKLQKHANDLQVLIIDNVAGNLSTITEDSILQFIDNLTDEIASKLVIDLKTLLGASTDTASLAAAQEAVVISIKQTNDKELQKTKDCFNQNLHNIYLKINQCSNDVQFKYDKIKRNLNYAIETSQMEQTSHNLVMVAKKLNKIKDSIHDVCCSMRTELNAQVIDTLTNINKSDFVINLNNEQLLALATFLETPVPENIPAKPPMMLSFNAYRGNSAVSNRTASSNIITSTIPRNKHSCSKGYGSVTK